MGFHEWFRISALVWVFLGAGYALYAWFKLRDKPEAILVAGSTLSGFSTMLPKWLNISGMWVGLGIACYGFVLTMRRACEAEEPLARSRRPATGPVGG